MARVKIEKNISYDDAKKLYYVNLDFGVVDGKQIKKSKTAKTLPDARKILKEHQADKTKGSLVMPKKITVAEWLAKWVSDIDIPNHAETTIRSNANIIKRITPFLGKIPLQELKPSQIQSYYTYLLNEIKLSSNTVKKHYELLNNVLEFAVKQDILLANPCRKTIPPKRIKPQITFYTLEQLQGLLSLVSGHRLETVVYLGAFYGLRREEIMGLTWGNVDFEKRELTIKEARTMAGSTVVVKNTKNESSTRKLYLVDEVREVLEAERQRQTENKKYFGEAYDNSNYVVAWDDGKPYKPNYMSELFTKFIKDNNMPPLTLHGLRHSFASLTNALGMSMYDASKMLGHSTPATTGNIYTHMYDNQYSEQSKIIANALKPTKKGNDAQSEA